MLRPRISRGVVKAGGERREDEYAGCLPGPPPELLPADSRTRLNYASGTSPHVRHVTKRARLRDPHLRTMRQLGTTRARSVAQPKTCRASGRAR